MEVTDLFSKGVDIFKNNPIIAGPLVGVGVISAVLSLLLVGGMSGGMGMMPGAFSLGAMAGSLALVGIISWLLNILAMGATYVMAAEAMVGTTDINSGINKTLGNVVNLLIAGILMGVIVFIGTILLVLPGLIAAYLLMFTLVLVMVGNRDPVGALKESYEMVRANISDTIVFAIIAIVVLIAASIIGGILGVVPIIGPLVISPVISGAAMAYVIVVQVLLYQELSA